MSANSLSVSPAVISGIGNIVEELDIKHSDVAETAQAIHDRAQSESLTRGRSDTAIHAAVVYIACKIEAVPVRPQEVASATDIDTNELFRANRQLTRNLSLPVPPVPPTAYIERYCTELNLSDDTKQTALDILDACTGDLQSATPTGLAASAIYGATQKTDDDITQQTLSEFVGISEVTIRNWYTRQLEEYNAE